MNIETLQVLVCMEESTTETVVKSLWGNSLNEIQSSLLAQKMSLQLLGCRFSDLHLLNGDSVLCFTLETKDKRFRECSIDLNNEYNIFEIRSNDHLMAMINL